MYVDFYHISRIRMDVCFQGLPGTEQTCKACGVDGRVSAGGRHMNVLATVREWLEQVTVWRHQLRHLEGWCGRDSRYQTVVRQSVPVQRHDYRYVVVGIVGKKLWAAMVRAGGLVYRAQTSAFKLD
jgi:hypothetical protein